MVDVAREARVALRTVSCVVNGRAVYDDIFVRGKRKPDVNLEADAMAMLMTWCDNGYTTSCDPLIVGFQPFDLF